MFVRKICILFQAECSFGFLFTCWQKTWEDFITVMKLAVASSALPRSSYRRRDPCTSEEQTKINHLSFGHQILPRLVDEANVGYYDCHVYASCYTMAPDVLKKQLQTGFSYVLTPQVCFQKVLSLCSIQPFSFSLKTSFED